MLHFFRALSLLAIGLSLLACSNNKNSSDNKKTEVQSELIRGERIDGPANFRDTVNGKVLFTLNDNTMVETSPTQNSWLLAGLYVSLSAQQRLDSKILPNEELLSNGKIIGKSIDTVHVWMAHEDYGMIGAYINIKNIKSNTVPENILTELIDNGKAKKDDFQSLMKNFNFEKNDDSELPGLSQYLIYESSVVDPSPRDRITLLFNEIEELVGVIHSRELPTKKFKTYELIRGHKLTITSKISDDEIKQLIDKRIKFYNSVD